MVTLDKTAESLVRSAKILVIDDEHYTRKVIRTLLTGIGVRYIFEADDGFTGIEAIKTVGPDIVLLDWEMRGLDGPGVMRVVRSPETFAHADVPIIMLTGFSEKSKVLEAIRLGIHEYLLKPVSSNALQARLLAVLAHPRPMVRRGSFYGPEPRKGNNAAKPQFDPTQTVFVN